MGKTAVFRANWVDMRFGFSAIKFVCIFRLGGLYSFPGFSKETCFKGDDIGISGFQ